MKIMTYGCWNLRCNRQKILSFWAIFCPFRPLKTWKIKILKLKKTLGDIIIWRICTINDNHIMYGSWDKNFCHSWLSFVLLPPYGPTKSKFFKNEKNIWRYYHFTNAFHKWQSYDVWFLRYRVQQTELFVILDQCFTLYSPLTTSKIRIKKKKKWKKCLEILSFYSCVP